VSRLPSVDERRVRDIEAALATIVDGRTALEDVMAPLRELLGSHNAIAYALAPRGDGLATEFLYADAFPADRFRRHFDEYLADKTFGWAGYNPIRPEPSQRNLVLDMRELSRWRDPRTVPLVRDVFPKWGLAGEDQLRVLLCDGPSLLAWVGAFQRGGFDARQKRLLKRLVPTLRKRLLVERAISGASRMRAVLDTALESIGGAAFVVNASGAISQANEAGRLLVAGDRRGTLEALRAAIQMRGASGSYEATRVSSPGAPDEYLVIAKRPSRVRAEPRAAVAAARWSLTIRQSQVLALVAQGLQNRTIAAKLGIAEGTVEVHLTAIFDKVGVKNRSALVARVWES
jgi:DNA-binding NarL/FixJ family response regulator